MADRPGLPDLTHQWYRSTAGHFCSLCAAPLVDSGADPCFARVIAYADEQRAAGAAETRARIVAWLRAKAEAAFAVRERQTVPDYGHYGAAYTWAADDIERGEDRTP